MLQESGKLLVKPYIEELPELFVSYFKEILRVGYNIPRLEYYMSHGKHSLQTEIKWIEHLPDSGIFISEKNRMKTLCTKL